MQRLLLTNAHLALRAPYSDRFVPYLYGLRNEMAIIDLEKTLLSLRRACHFVDLISSARGHLLFVNTTSEYNIMVQSTASLAKQSYINHKWVGGLLTNWSHMQNVQHHFHIFSTNAPQSSLITQTTDLKAFTKRKAPYLIESVKAKRKSASLQTFDYGENLGASSLLTSFPRFKKMQKCFEGLVAKQLPDCIIVLNATHNAIAIHEAAQLRIPIIALVDSKTPHELHQMITYAIPANGDSLSFVYLFCNCLLKTIRFAKNRL